MPQLIIYVDLETVLNYASQVDAEVAMTLLSFYALFNRMHINDLIYYKNLIDDIKEENLTT